MNRVFIENDQLLHINKSYAVRSFLDLGHSQPKIWLPSVQRDGFERHLVQQIHSRITFSLSVVDGGRKYEFPSVSLS